MSMEIVDFFHLDDLAEKKNWRGGQSSPIAALFMSLALLLAGRFALRQTQRIQGRFTGTNARI